MSAVEYRRPIEADIADLNARMRPADRAELEAIHPGDLMRVLERAVAVSADCWTATADGELIALFGVAPVSTLAGIGSPWLLGAPELERQGRALVRDGRRYLAQVRTCFPCLVNFVDARNAVSIRWLLRLGFAVDPPASRGRRGEAFCRFTMGD